MTTPQQLDNVGQRPRGNARSPAIIEARRLKVVELFLQGMTTREIVEALPSRLKASKSTIAEDIHVEWTKIRDYYQTKRADFVLCLEAEFDMLWREGWRLYHTEPRNKREQAALFQRLAALKFLGSVVRSKTHLATIGHSSLSTFTSVSTKEGTAFKIENLAWDEKEKRRLERCGEYVDDDGQVVKV